LKNNAFGVWGSSATLESYLNTNRETAILPPNSLSAKTSLQYELESCSEGLGRKYLQVLELETPQLKLKGIPYLELKISLDRQEMAADSQIQRNNSDIIAEIF
jgi:hypothetical protein